jgi:hypothetical protein
LEKLSLVGLLLAYKSNAVSNSIGRNFILGRTGDGKGEMTVDIQFPVEELDDTL